KGSPDEFAEAALSKGMPRLGFSGHNVLPFPAEWTMPAGNLESYLREVRETKERYRGRLEVFLGMEVDYLPGITSPVDPVVRSLGLDFIIGSVHFIASVNGEYPWTVDGSPEEFALGLRESFGGDVRALVERYYERIAEMAGSAAPDIIGHFDIVKKNNRQGRWFSEEAPWYRGACRAALEAVARSGSILEINTGGIVRNTSGALYPSSRILQDARQLGIPVMVNADAHRPDHIDGHFTEAVALLRELGFRSQRQLTSRGWIDQAL
ncbi:MAG: histidinol-phosphatase, partial [Acidobacteria bacterium]|nr:histidinol-phosphatase [Acidobacteriota bacterium]